MEKLDKLLSKKKKEGRMLSDNEKDAKMSVVHALQKFASGEISKKLEGSKGSKAPEDFLQAKKSDEIHDADEGKSSYSVNEALGDDEGESEAVDGHDAYSGDSETDSSPEDEESEDSIDAKLKELMSKKAAFKSRG